MEWYKFIDYVKFKIQGGFMDKKTLNAKQIVFILTGLLLLVTVGITYLPNILKNGLYEFELTLLSNTITGMLFIIGGIYGICKKKDLPHTLYLNSVLLLQLVFFICMAFISEFRFSGGYVFLHIINPIIATIVYISLTECRKMPGIKVFLSALIFPFVYLIYVITYGFLSGFWLYGILNIDEHGLPFVTVLVLLILCGLILLEWLQYKLCYHINKKRNCKTDKRIEIIEEKKWM